MALIMDTIRRLQGRSNLAGGGAAGGSAVQALIDKAKAQVAGTSGTGFAGGGAAGPTAVQDVINDAKTQTKDAIAASIPDNYAAVLREFARARTQMMIRNTNGQRGSLLGIGTDNYSAPGGIGSGRISAPSSASLMQPFRNALNTRVRLL